MDNLPVSYQDVGVYDTEYVEQNSNIIATDNDFIKLGKSIIAERNKFIEEFDIQTKKLQQLYYDRLLVVNQNIELYNIMWSIHNRTIELINYFGIYIWKDSESNKICYRINPYGKRKEGNKNKISYELSSRTGHPIILCDKVDDIRFDGNRYIVINSTNIPIIEHDIFYPINNLEFITINNKLYRNVFEYSKFLNNRILNYIPSINYNIEQYNGVIGRFIHFLTNNKEQETDAIMNWLSNFSKNLTKSNIALVLIGDKEVTEDIFLKEIIEPIFGKKYCITIDDETLSKESEDTIIKDKIIYHIGDISKEASNSKKIKNIVRKLLLPNSVSPEYVIENPDTETYIYGEILITSDEPYSFIKDSYSQCCVIEVNSINFILEKLGYKDSISLYRAVKEDLHNFSNYLRCYISNSFDEYPNTTVKRNLERDENELITEFSQNIKNKNTSYFEKIKYENLELYEEIVKFFSYDAIKQKNLSLYFNILYKGYNFSNKYLIEKLKEQEPLFKEKTKTIPNINDNDKVYLLPKSSSNRRIFRKSYSEGKFKIKKPV